MPKLPFRYSTLQDWHKCQMYYYFKHVLGLNDGGDKSGDMAFGTCIHTGVQDLLEGGDGIDVFSTYWGLQEAKGLTYTRLKHADLARVGVELLEVFRDEHMRHFKPAHLEKKLVHALPNGIPYSGTVDKIGTYKGVPSVVDWKTSAAPYGPHKIIVNEQMYGYAWLAEKELGFAAEQVVYGVAVKDPKNPRWQFRVQKLGKQIVNKQLTNIEATCDAITRATTFVRNPNQCVTGSYGNERLCPFYERCHSQEDDNGGEEGEAT